MAKTSRMLVVATIIGLMVFGFFGGVPGFVVPRAAAASGPAFDYVVTILMENNGYCDVMTTCGGTGTYETTLAQTYAISGSCQSDSSCSSAGYSATSHPSEGNYISLIGGSDYGHANDGYCCWGITGPNIIDRIESAGKTWQAFAEDAGNSGTCNFSPPRSADHFAFLTFGDMNTAARCSHFLTTSSSSDPEFLSTLNSASPANYIWLTPNDIDNGHESGVSGGDGYLSGIVPKILTSSLFTTKNAALFIVYDEGNSNYPNDYVYASWSGPTVKKAFVGSGPYTHYSYSKTLETIWNMASLGTNDVNAQAMTEFFGPTSPLPLSTSFTLSAGPVVNTTVVFTATTTGGTGPYTVAWSFGDGSSGTGAITTHTYLLAQTFQVTETVTDSSSPLQTATSSQSVTASSQPPPGGPFDCTNWDCTNTLSPSSIGVGSNGTAEIRQSNPSACGWTNSYYDSMLRGSFPWGTTTGTPLSSGITDVSATVKFLSRDLSGNCGVSGSRYHLFIALYYQLGSGVSCPSGGIGANRACWLDTQVRVENIGGVDSPIGTTGTYTSQAIGWDNVTLQLSPGQTGTLTGNVTHQAQQDLLAYGLPSSTPYTLMGVEIGTEGYGFNAINTNWYNVYFVLSNAPPPPSVSFTVTPTSLQTGQIGTFSGSASGGTPPYSYSWDFGDGSSVGGSIATHTYSTSESYTTILTVSDSRGLTVSTSNIIVVAPIGFT